MRLEHVYRVFTKFGTIVSLERRRDLNRVKADIQFSDVKEAAAAVADAQRNVRDYFFYGHVVRVDFSFASRCRLRFTRYCGRPHPDNGKSQWYICAEMRKKYKVPRKFMVGVDEIELPLDQFAEKYKQKQPKKDSSESISSSDEEENRHKRDRSRGSGQKHRKRRSTSRRSRRSRSRGRRNREHGRYGASRRFRSRDRRDRHGGRRR
mmetsp:Transcript_22386/g.39636  ORF Transcript_22386/g.39636 Transcript_22386/m.39636 type:complete len:207 (+) Transcript_22386:79-699(+)